MTARLVAAAALLLAGCSGWMGGDEEEKLPGERLSVMSRVEGAKAASRVAGLEIRLPEAVRNPDWPQDGGPPSHAPRHVAAAYPLAPRWEADAGAGSGGESWLLAQPVIAGGRVFTMDAAAEVRARDAASGRLLWRRALAGGDDEGILGGGLAAGGERLYATTGLGDVAALDAATGEEVWRKRLGAPVRAAPALSDGRLFVVTTANELAALDAADGREAWTHSGLDATTTLVGGGAPAVAEGVVVAPFSSGEAAALRAGNGRVVWTESLAALRRSDAVTALAHVRGRPVVDGGTVFLVGHGNRAVAVDLRTGTRFWEAPVGGLHGPWVAGEFVYVATRNAEVVCLTRRRGLVRWVARLPRFDDPEDRTGPIVWAGPVLAGDRLLVAGSNAELRVLSPYSGEVLDVMRLPGPVLIPPSVADGTVYLLTDEADLIALR